MGVLAFSLMAAKIQADAYAVLEVTFPGEGFGNRSPFLEVEDTHCHGFVQGFLLIPHWIWVGAIRLGLNTFGHCSRLFCIRFLISGCCGGCPEGIFSALLDEECPRKGRNSFWDRTVFDMLSHLLEELGH